MRWRNVVYVCTMGIKPKFTNYVNESLTDINCHQNKDVSRVITLVKILTNNYPCSMSYLHSYE